MKGKLMNSEDPWHGISPPEQSVLINARRIDPALPWDLFWAVDSERQCLLVLRHGAEVSPADRLLKIRGLRVETQSDDQGGQILIRLLEPEQREIFSGFCQDVVRATCSAKTEAEAVARFLGRTWRWHRLLKSGGDERLSEEEQRGLIGELRLIEKHLLPVLGPVGAVRSWTGPLDAARDFEISTLHVETKTRRPMQNAVVVSSERQLDPEGCDRLFLHVAQIAAATEETETGFTVTDAAKRVLRWLEARDPLAVGTFEERLLAAGLEWEHDYSDCLWLVTAETLFEVKDAFPRVTRSMLPAGIEDVRYRLALAECEDHRVEFAVLKAALAGDSHDA